MDLSSEYINMLSRAYELQLKKNVFERGDFYIERRPITNDDCVLSFDSLTFCQETVEKKQFNVWYPRLDQICDFIQNYSNNNSISFLNLCTNTYGLKLGRRGFDSLEKHFLSILMYNNFDKQWDSKQWVKNDRHVNLDNQVKVWDENEKVWIERKLDD